MNVRGLEGTFSTVYMFYEPLISVVAQPVLGEVNNNNHIYDAIK